ncbi:MAG TPA: UbiA-like polyprenyltransferase [Candidatus Wallbacteria bacterium]|nr:UbiA-like polyprenyltransferase [Candidatus Wallbacteria bacterium]
MAELVKFEHTIFALPFAFIGLLIGSAGRPDFKTVLLVLAAMTGARTAAMGFNRLIDASIDAKNPRTQNRALPAGLISKTGVASLIVISLAVFFASAFAINEVCFILSPLAVFLLLFYSYTKRFTSLSHFALGLTLAVSPSAGYLAANTVLTLAPLVLSAAVLTWVAGFDIIYACQDIDFDKKEKLYSLPAVAGLGRSLIYSRLLHFFTVSCFILLGYLIAARPVYYFFVAMCAALLIYEHFLLRGSNLKNVNAAFFNVNGSVSIAMFFAVLLNYWI